MIELLTTAFYVVLCVLLFAFAILIHEFGHFVVALKLGLRVEAFSIGFGHALWKRTWRGVEYRIGWIPLGGYVSIPDVDPEGTKVLEKSSRQLQKPPRTVQSGGIGDAALPLYSGRGASPMRPQKTPQLPPPKSADAPKVRIPAWKELAVAFAGPAMNIVLAVVLAIGLSLVPGAKFGTLAAKIGRVPEKGPAFEAGLKAGDVVKSVGGRPVETWTEMQTEVQIAGGKPVEFVVARGAADAAAPAEEVRLTITPRRDEVSGAWFIMALSETNATGAVAWMPARSPWKQLAWDAGSIFRVLKGLVTPKEAKATAGALGGPVMIAEGLYRQVRRDKWDGLGFLRFLNVNLAVLNLLPIPVLDGGLILFALIALVFRRRLPDWFVAKVSMAFMFLLIGLMGTLILKDSWRSYKIHTFKPDNAETNVLEKADPKP